MDVRLSPEQQQLRQAAARMAERLGPATVAGLEDAGRTARLAAAVDEAGWRHLRLPGDDGAPAAGAVEVCLVAEELGRALCDVAFVGPVLASEIRRRAGAPAAPGVETVVLAPTLDELAVAAPGQAADGLAVDSAGAQGALVLCAQGSGFRPAWTAIEPTAVQVDLTRSTCAPETAPVVPIEGACPLSEEDVAACAALGLALACADLVGVMRGALELARGHAVERRQFGKPIATFQAVAHLLADAKVVLEGSRSVALYAAWAADALPAAQARAAGSLAKAYCARAARQVCESAIQVHGGMGNTWDCLAHVFLRRALLSGELLGGAERCVARVLEYHGITTCAGSSRALR